MAKCDWWREVQDDMISSTELGTIINWKIENIPAIMVLIRLTAQSSKILKPASVR